ncbi:chemotaxis protein CheW [Brevibacillus dissolubilis]|uniref:chemotaxis protein CheW n=1 Tax=Brevibacillus dissolubilis TaxID=1844116 RepID=UPI001117338E|nr:chemotaxis protein CheW [Brevibacillus dissolubilis]
MDAQHKATNWQDEAETLQAILFKMGNEFYGLPIDAVKEIIKPLPVTRFPKSPEYVEGVINLRGQILPIVNLRNKFGLEPLEITEDSRFIDLNLGALKLGIVVDAVSEVERISQKMIEPAPPIVAGVEGKYLRGIAHLGERLVMLLDLDEIFAEWQKK